LIVISKYNRVDSAMAMRCIQYSNGDGLHGRPWAFEPPLFHTPSFVANQFPDGGYVSFTLEAESVIYAIVHFKNETKDWVSLPKSPFGGISCAKQAGVDDLSVLIDAIVAAFKGQKVTLHVPFEGYPSMAGQIANVLLIDKGFVETYSDVHHFLELEYFSGRIHESQLRRLEKCAKASFRFIQEPGEHLEEIYLFLDSCRKDQGLTINISFEDLKRSIDRFASTYRLFSIRDKQRLMAACITCRVSSEVLYYFLPGSERAYSAYSPMVMLISELSALADKEGYKMIDLGKSSVLGVVQKGLSTFKTRMGAKAGERKCFFREV